MKFDDILQEIGEFGPYQKRVFYLICLPIIISGAQTFSVIFIYDIPAYRCVLPDYPNDTYHIQNEAHARLVNQSIPPAEDSAGDVIYSGCTMYSHTNTSITSAPYDRNMSLLTQTCSHRIYDKTDYKETIITEFDLVCGGEIMRSHANMMAFAGSFCGSMCMGIFADVFGRKKAILLGLLFEIVSSLTAFFAQSFYVIMAARFLGGVATHSLFAISATTGIELLGRNKRSFAGVVVELAWSVGVILIAPAAYALRQWRYIQLVITIAALPIFSLYWLIPESPRWLLEKERYREVKVTLKKICEANKCELPKGAIDADTNDEGPQMKIWAMFTNKVLIFRCLIIFFNWLAVNLLYYGLSLNTTNLEGSPYINYLFSAVVEAGGYAICLPFMDRMGRRKFHCICMYIGSVACLGAIPTILFDGPPWIMVVLSLVGKFCSSGCYTVLYVFSAELFPTVLRNSAIGFCAVFESLGGMFSPYIADLGLLVGGPMGKGIPMIVFGGLSFLAGGFALLLPETLHRKLPESIQDAIDFAKQEPDKPKAKDGYERAHVSFEDQTII